MAGASNQTSDDLWREMTAGDVVVVPFIFVPDGATADPQWLRDHPDYIALPAVLVRDTAAAAQARSVQPDVASEAGFQLASMESYDEPPPPQPPAPLTRVAGANPRRLVIYVGGFLDGSDGPVKDYFSKLKAGVAHDSADASFDDQAAIERLINETPAETVPTASR